MKQKNEIEEEEDDRPLLVDVGSDVVKLGKRHKGSERERDAADGGGGPAYIQQRETWNT